jgi:hypothetical protein
MNIGLNPLRIVHLVSILLFTTVVAACANMQGAGQVAGAVAQAELFTFKHVRLQRDADGTYDVNIKIVDVCRKTRFTQDQLFETFRNGNYRRTAAGLVESTGSEFPFTFDLLAACNSPGELRFETANLTEPVVDADGNVTYLHPHGIDADLSGGGVLDINIGDFHFHVYNPAHVKAPGPMTLDRIELPGDSVGGASADTYTSANIVNPYFAWRANSRLRPRRRQMTTTCWWCGTESSCCAPTSEAWNEPALIIGFHGPDTPYLE